MWGTFFSSFQVFCGPYELCQNIVAFLPGFLDGNGFEDIDIGVDFFS